MPEVKYNKNQQRLYSHDYTQTELGEWVKKIYSGNFLETENGIDTVTSSWGRSADYYLHNTSIKKTISIINPKTILDYGCGESIVVENLQQEFPNIQYTKYDPYIERYKDYPIGQYDFIMCNLVIHLLNPDMKTYVIQELHRLNTGYVFVSVVITNIESNIDYSQNKFNNINRWKNEFKDLFDIVTYGGTRLVPEDLTHLKNKKIISFLLKNI